MAYPPTTPPSNRLTTNPGSLPAQDHDQLTVAVNDIVTELGSTPKGAAASLSARLNAVETTASAGATGPVGMVWRGPWSSTVTYGLNDAFYNTADGLSYITIQGATGIAAPNTTYYQVLSGQNTMDAGRSRIGWEIFPASEGTNGTGNGLATGVQAYTFFRAMATTAITKIKVTVAAAVTGGATTHAWAGIYDVDSSYQVTTLLASSADLTTFGNSGFQSMYKTSSISNQFTFGTAWTPTTLGKMYALAILWVGTGTGPFIRGRTLDGAAPEAGYSAVAGTVFAAKTGQTALAALWNGATPNESASTLQNNSLGIQMGALFLP